MKRLLSILLVAVMLFNTVPFQIFANGGGAPIGTGEPNVTLVGQWTEKSSKKEDTFKHYELQDKIGYPLSNPGRLRSLAKQFLGWSDKAPIDNGVLAEGAKLFSPEDTVADVFGSAIPDDAKIYAVYYEINEPYGSPFPEDPFSLAKFGVLGNLKNRIDDNNVYINKSVAHEDVLKNTKWSQDKGSKDTIIDYYEKKKKKKKK